METVRCWNIKIILSTTLALLFTTITVAQTPDTTVVSNRWSLSVGNMTVVDQYLSNQEYSGTIYGFQAQHGAYYRQTDRHVSWHFYDHWRYGRLINSSYSALINYASVNIGFGSHYNWHILKGLTLKAGGIIDAHGAIKLQSRNVNNPASGDIRLQLLASGAIQYSLLWDKFALLVGYSLSTPFAGCMFVPEMGQSYYEIYLKLPHGLHDITHFTSFHNMQAVSGNLHIECIFKGFTLYTAFNHEYSHWQANNLMFRTRELSGQIGVIVDMIYRCGRHSQPEHAVTF